MADPLNDELQQLREEAEKSRFAKLRALGRELDLRIRLDLLKRESAARQQQSAAREQHLLAELDRGQREFERAQREFENTKRALLAELEQQRLAAEELRANLALLFSSRSWKLTRPLRYLTERLGMQQQPAEQGNAPTHLDRDDGVEAVSIQNEQQAADSREDDAGPTDADASQSHNEAEAGNGEPAAQSADQQQQSKAGADDFVTGGKAAWDEAGSQRLREFLDSDRRLRFPMPEKPVISIVIALLNKAHLTYLCLEALLAHAGLTYELIVVDNGSADATGELLKKVDGAKIIRNSDNVGFGPACMQGAEAATGEFLCFLNNDTVVCPGALEAAVADFREDLAVGVVGGKLLLANGRLQEAGSMVWNDATAWGYGRDDDACSPKYGFRRPVDYCSGALLFTPRALFRELGGFDATFAPAYYEDTDYCFKVWERGLRVIYEPLAAVHHYESASMQTTDAAGALISEQRTKFAAKWRGRLGGQLRLAGDRIPYARIAVGAGGARVIYMTRRIPHLPVGQESAKENEFLRWLVGHKHHVSCVPICEALAQGEYTDIPREVELADAKSATHYVFRELLSQYDAVWVADRESMRELLWRLRNMDERVAPIIYQPATVQAEAREVDADDWDGSFEENVTFCQAADIVLVGSEQERQLLLDNRVSRVEIMSEQTTARILDEVALWQVRSKARA